MTLFIVPHTRIKIMCQAAQRKYKLKERTKARQPIQATAESVQMASDPRQAHLRTTALQELNTSRARAAPPGRTLRSSPHNANTNTESGQGGYDRGHRPSSGCQILPTHSQTMEHNTNTTLEIWILMNNLLHWIFKQYLVK